MIGKLANYFIVNQFYNMIRLTSYLLFYIGLILRFTNIRTEEDFLSAKIVLVYDLELWFLRSLTFLGIAQKMGPKLVMIRKMVYRIRFSSIIVFVFSLDHRFILFYLYYTSSNDCLWYSFSNNA
jgi:hypothetical protein